MIVERVIRSWSHVPMLPLYLFANAGEEFLLRGPLPTISALKLDKLKEKNMISYSIGFVLFVSFFLC